MEAKKLFTYGIWGGAILGGLALMAINYGSGRLTNREQANFFPLMVLFNLMAGGTMLGPISTLGLTLITPTDLLNKFGTFLFLTEVVGGGMAGAVLPSFCLLLGMATNPRLRQNSTG